MVASSYSFDPATEKDSRSRRRRIAEQLMMQGMDTSPIQHPMQGAARMAQALMGGIELGMEDKKERELTAAMTAHNSGLLERAIGGGEAGSPVTAALAGKPIGGPIKLGGFEPSVGRVLEFEGGLNPADTNGTPSNFGINQKANPDVDVANLTPQGATEIYRKRYWDAIGADKMDPRLAHVAFDTAVIAGPGKANELLKASGGDPEKFLSLREAFQRSLIQRDPEKFGKYEKAWGNRVATLRSDVGVGGGGAPGGMFAVGSGQPTLAGGDNLSSRGGPDKIAQLIRDYNNPLTTADNKKFLLSEIERLRKGADPAAALELDIKREQLRKLREKPAVDPLEQRAKELAIKKAERELDGTGKAPEVRVIKQPDGSEVAVQWDTKANDWKPLVAPEGGNAVRSNKPLTEAQSKDANFYNRGSSILDRLEKQDSALTSYTGTYGGKLPLVGNIVKGDAYRQAEQTGRELLAVILRKDTGAAVTKDETALYGDMYLPVPGDDPVTMQQKRDGRRAAIEGIKLGLPSATILEIQRAKLDAIKEKGAAGAAQPPQKVRRWNPQTGKLEDVTQ